MLGVHPFGLAGLALIPDEIMPPDVAIGVQLQVTTSSPVDHDGFHRIRSTSAKRIVDNGFQMVDLAAAPLLVRSNHGYRACVNNPFMQAFGGEAAEHD